MPIAVRCACGKEYHFKDEYAGRRAKCPACGQVVRIPGTRPAGRPSPHFPLREDRRSRTRELALLGSAGFAVLVGIGLVVYFLFLSGPKPYVPRPAVPAPAQPSALAGTGPEPAPQAPGIPVDVSYFIIDLDILPGVKRSLNVRLNKKVSQATLRAIALKLKSQDSREYECTFINYWLPEMQVGSGAWATTHFGPELEVYIQGLTVQEEKALLKEPVPANREVIGRWFDEIALGGCRITIFREQGNLYVELKFKDGSSSKERVVESSSPLGRRLAPVARSPSGDYWVIDSRGNLQTWDDEGLFSTAQRWINISGKPKF